MSHGGVLLHGWMYKGGLKGTGGLKECWINLCMTLGFITVCSKCWMGGELLQRWEKWQEGKGPRGLGSRLGN